MDGVAIAFLSSQMASHFNKFVFVSTQFAIDGVAIAEISWNKAGYKCVF